MPEIQHEDFGEKIGGAKKELWGRRGLYTADLDDMNGREADRFVKKDNVWKKPDYEAMMGDGVPVDIAYFKKVVRDSLPAVPRYLYDDTTPEKRLLRQKQYVETVRAIQALTENVETVEDALSLFDRFMIENGYYERNSYGISGVRMIPTEKVRSNPTITDKAANAMYFQNERSFERKIVREAVASQFGISKEQKVPRGYEIHFNDGKGSYSRNGDWQPDTYYVTKGYHIVCTNLESREAALKWVQEYVRQRSASGKKRFVPEQLANVRRTGPEYRSGQDVVGQDYLDAFAFRGGEFGNWLNQLDRQASLNMGFEALKDLAAALQISEKDISYGGVLSIAFGARGSGSAVAHYEPMRKVINLTKMRGAGSLAHEWWHGLDDYLGEKMGVKGFLSESPRSFPLIQKLIDTMRFKPETPEQAAQRAEQQLARDRDNAGRWLDASVLNAVKRKDDPAITVQYEALKAAFLAGDEGSLDRINDFKKSISGHVIPKSERETLATYERILCSRAEQTEPTIGRTETDYFKNSRRMGKECEKDGGYWESNTEMTARAFACYVSDRLPYQSDYLCGHAECAVTFITGKDGGTEILKAYPQGEERKAINAVFDEIVADLKLEQILTHCDRPEPLAERTAAEAQVSLFSIADKPSVLGQLAAGRILVKETPAAAESKMRKEPEI